MNYRVNALGFMASNQMEAAAKAGHAILNAGLYDIQLALLWVQENIGCFGGDPDKVRQLGCIRSAFIVYAMLKSCWSSF